MAEGGRAAGQLVMRWRPGCSRDECRLARGMIDAARAANETGTRLVLAPRLARSSGLIGVERLEADPAHHRAALGCFIDSLTGATDTPTRLPSAAVRRALRHMGVHRVQARHMIGNPRGGRGD